ncbi:hypothetical protein, variant 1 [Aphanomyces astaci]|uniref:Uncharacterized protein n=1 Tax=Aphanomyces astaci TaxID=112090 RepID=W4GAY9_APHAT|nr:hypothetical protein, variant 1 [Aphanomyces astaci]ETV76098.1 hypothetical protein, variant 1 [Aphanomyces astaci]|eukprot:XP_009834224.1 hypothetical protein, variant 1 [Aphanomyces astaci]
MSYRLIEARFQMLDEAVARLDKSKHTKLNASVGLRGSVRINPHDVATWIRPSHPRSSTSIAPPSSSSSSDSSSPVTLISPAGPSFNQSTHDVHLTLRRSTLLSRQAKPDVHPLIVHRAPASHDWGHPHDEYDDDDDGCLAPVDPKEAKVHRVAHDTWECINTEIQASTVLTPGHPSRLVKSATAARSQGATRSHRRTGHPAINYESTVDENEQRGLHIVPEAATHSSSSAADNQRQQPHRHDPHQPVGRPITRGRLVRQPWMRHPDTSRRNWFTHSDQHHHHGPTSVSTHGDSTTTAGSSKNRRHRPTTASPGQSSSASLRPQPPRGSDDPAYYYLEIRLEHATSLAGWTFRVIVTDTTHPSQPAALFNRMQCNASNCIVFDKDPPIPSTWPSSSKKKHVKTTATEPILRSTIFDPTRYFDHVSQPIDLYGHSLRIQVVSEGPVQKTIVDTMVHFTDANNGAALSADELLQVLGGSKPPPLVVDDKTPEEAPPSTHDNSEYIYRNHFEAVYATDVMPSTSANKVHEVMAEKTPAPISTGTMANDVEGKKRELQRMRESMMVRWTSDGSPSWSLHVGRHASGAAAAIVAPLTA